MSAKMLSAVVDHRGGRENVGAGDFSTGRKTQFVPIPLAFGATVRDDPVATLSRSFAL